MTTGEYRCSYLSRFIGNRREGLDVLKKWGDSYYCFDEAAYTDSESAQNWIGRIDTYQPDLKAKVERAGAHWNLIIRDQLSNETALRLTNEDGATQIPVRVADSIPLPLMDILANYDE